MTTFAQIIIEFNEDPSVGANFVLDYGPGNIIENWVTLRVGPNQVTEGDPIPALPGLRGAINFSQAFELDYAFLNFVVLRNGNFVTIKATDPTFEFSFPSGHPTIDINTTIDNGTNEPLYFVSRTFTESSTVKKCTLVDLNITTNVQADQLNLPSSATINSNPFTISANRGTTVLVEIEGQGQVVQQHYITPPKLLWTALNINQQVSPQGTTLTIGFSDPFNLLDLEFSLNGVDFQTENVFSGLPPDEYTLTVRDQLGCQISNEIDIDENGISSPFFAYPKANSIRMANLIVHGDSGNYKNEENTLSSEEDCKKPYTEIQQFQSGDIITTQFKSNYPTRIANVTELCPTGGGGPVIAAFTIPITKKTFNIGRQDRRDALKFGLGNGKTGIYFTSGYTYDFNGFSILGSYILNGALPEWGRIGNYLRIDGTNWYQIEDIIFDETRNAEVLVIDLLTFGTSDAETDVSSIYNREEYEVYEYDIDMAEYQDKKIQVILQNKSPYWEDITYRSEIIEVKIRHKDTIELKSYNRNNTDILFSTGIVCLKRLPLEGKSEKPLTELELNKSDTDTVLLTANGYEQTEFELGPMATGMMRSVIQNLIASNVQMDGVEYRCESINVEGPLEDTNLFIVKPLMTKARDVYNSDSGIGAFGEGNIEIPALIDGGSEFIRYQ